MAEKVFTATGRRKTSVARVALKRKFRSGGCDSPRDHARPNADQSRAPFTFEKSRLCHARPTRSRAKKIRTSQGEKTPPILQALNFVYEDFPLPGDGFADLGSVTS